MRCPRQTATLAVSLLIAGCSNDARIVAFGPELPADITWRGFLLEDDRGRITNATGLTRVAPYSVARFELPEDAASSARVHLIGYTDEALAEIMPSDSTLIQTTPLAIADATTPLLKAFIFSGLLIVMTAMPSFDS